MPRKRTNEHLLDPEKVEKWQKKRCVKMVNPGEDHLEKECPPDLSSPQSTTEMVSLPTTIEQLEKFVRAGNEDAARQLLTHQEINLSTAEGGDLLWTAYALGMTEIAIMLVQYGADLTVRKHSDKRTLLHHILRGSRIQCTITRNLFSLMLDFGADVNACDNEGNTLLHDAITSCHVASTELAEELLNHGAQVTINKEKPLQDHVYLACQNKIDLLPKLIQHQNPDMLVRDCRATVAIHGLMSAKYTDDETASAALLVMRKILQLGVPHDVLDKHGEWKMSFLNRALYHKNIAAIQLLLKYGAEFHHKNSAGHTCLYQATSFEDTTKVSRLLIKRGVSIQVRNSNGDYPIHGACKHKSLRNLRLLLNLGADVNSTNEIGQTPFGTMQPTKKKNFADIHHLLIKHLALTISRGKNINNQDRAKINKYAWIKSYFSKCLEQSERMKLEKVHSDTPYFSMLSKNMYSMMQMVKDQNFIKSFKQNRKRQVSLFPYYSGELSHSFNITEKRLEVLLEKKEDLCKAFMGILPDSILEKIAYYLCFEKLKHCNYEYFISLDERKENRLKYRNKN